MSKEIYMWTYVDFPESALNIQSLHPTKLKLPKHQLVNLPPTLQEIHPTQKEGFICIYIYKYIFIIAGLLKENQWFP